jgi:hypothetical protein
MTASSDPRRRLAYVFWHWKQPAVARDDYERRQQAFHAALAAAPSVGFEESLSFAVTGLGWAADGGLAYEDWYLVSDWGALGALNEAAVSAGRAIPHDAAAAAVADGAGGLYALRLGAPVASPRVAHWFAKPAGMRYDELFRMLSPVVDGARGALWMRQMVLGPARELCLHAGAPVSLPAPLSPLVVPLRRAWRES